MKIKVSDYFDSTESLLMWCTIDDSSVCGILDEYLNTLKENLKYIKKESPDDLFGNSRDVITKRNTIYLGLLARSMAESDRCTFAELQKASDDILTDLNDLLYAPASSKYHGDWEGGLMDHSIMVYYAALKLKTAHYMLTDKPEPKKLLPIFFLLHDACKCGTYELTNKNVKNPNTGKWETKEVYGNKDVPMAFHGAESVNRIYELLLKYPEDLDWLQNCFTINWRLAITYHMGMYGLSDADSYNYNSSKKAYPEVLLMHHADMIASQLGGF